MKILPSFKPSISYGQLNRALLRLLFGGASEQATSKFERKFAQHLGVKYAIQVPSGRWGLYYILKGLNLKESDEIILPAFTYFAVPSAIFKLGLKPIFVDINPGNLNIDIQKIEENITEKTRVIILAHLCGFACELDGILDIARRYNIKVIEDCAQALGAEYKGKKLGSWGSAAYFTFGITKNFTTLGAGMIVTNNSELADSSRSAVKKIRPTSKMILFLKLLKSYVMKLAVSSLIFPVVYCIIKIFALFGIDIIDCIFHEKESLLNNPPKKGQLNNIQSELGIALLSDLDKKNEMKIVKGLELYRRLACIDNIQIPLLEENAKNIFSTCPILVKNKKKTKKLLLKKGINVSSGYMQDCSKVKIFKEFFKHCPHASAAQEKVLYLPIYDGLTHSELTYIVNTVIEVSRL